MYGWRDEVERPAGKQKRVCAGHLDGKRLKDFKQENGKKNYQFKLLI